MEFAPLGRQNRNYQVHFEMAPVLEITDGHGGLLPSANFQVFATMLYPDDPEARDALVDCMSAGVIVESGQSRSRKELRLAIRLSAQANSLTDLAAAHG